MTASVKVDKPVSIQVMVVDDHPAIRCGLSALFQHEAGFTVVGEASNGIEAVEKARQLSPEVILMDLAMPQKNGLEAISEILKFLPKARILIFTSYSDGDQIMAAIKAGAMGYIMKDSSPQEIFNAVRAVSQGKPALNINIELSLINQIQHSHPSDVPVERLSEREIEVLRWMAEGLTNAQIAQKAYITEGTVRSHISNLLAKLGLANRAQAVIYAVRKGLVDLDL